jgi:hypothetical protein
VRSSVDDARVYIVEMLVRCSGVACRAQYHIPMGAHFGIIDRTQAQSV